MPKPTSEARRDVALAKMQAGYIQLKALMEDRHPEPGCLPLPSLAVPTTSRDAKAYLGQLAAAMHNSDSKWTHTRDHCCHTPGYALRGIWTAWRKWQAIVWAADRYLTGQTRNGAETGRFLNELYAAIAALKHPGA